MNADWTKNYDELTFTDDFMFGKVMEDLDLCRRVIGTLLRRDVGELEQAVPQREFRYTREGKPIRLDVYARSESEGDDLPEGLRHLYDYVRTGRTADELTRELEAAVTEGRRREEWRSEYMKERALMMDMLNDIEEANARAEASDARADAADARAEKAEAETKTAKDQSAADNARAEKAEAENKKFRQMLIDNGINPDD